MFCLSDDMKVNIFLHYICYLKDLLNKLSCLTYAYYLESEEIISWI